MIPLSKNELIFNPNNYFYFNNIKILSFLQLYKMKKNRADEKDINDCKIMEPMIESNSIKKFVSRFKQSILYGKIKLRFELILLLKIIGLYNIVKTLKM